MGCTKKGSLIVITGGDLQGKATNTTLLAKVLDAEILSFPDYNTPTGQIIKAALTNSYLGIVRTLYNNNKLVEQYIKTFEPKKLDMNPYAFQTLQTVERMEKQDFIRETLASGKHIVADRYDVDSLVYGAEDGCSEEWLKHFLTCLIPSDLVLVLFGNQKTRNEVADVNESNLDFMSRISNRYRKLCEDNSTYDDNTFVKQYNKYIPIDVVDSKDKWESIWLTHKEIVKIVNDEFFMYTKPLTKEECKEVIESSNKNV